MRRVEIHGARLYVMLLAAVRIRRKTLTLAPGEKMGVRTHDSMARRLAAERWYEPAVRRKARRHVHRGSTVVDVGANIGYYTVQAASLAGPDGRVLAFEPQPATRRELAGNVALNEFSNVAILPYALLDIAFSTYSRQSGTSATI